MPISNLMQEEFKARVESMDDCKACLLGKSPCLVEDKVIEKKGKVLEDADPSEKQACKALIKKETMAALLIPGADKIR